MAAVTKLLVNHNLKRCICTGSVNHGSYAARQGKFMNKLLGESSNKRKWFAGKARITENTAITHKITSNHVTRRMTVLNKLFMQHITDLMACGEVATELVGRKIEVTHVKVTPDFQKVLVFWGSKMTGQETETAKLLNNCAFGLRHELTQLRVIGQVPMIQFVKNRKLEGLCELEKRLKVADYGEDFEPTLPPVAPKLELTLTKNLSPDIRKKILEMEDCLEEEEEEDDSKYDVNLPPMRHDVLGLDHSAIMNRVQQSLKKVREGAKNRLLNMTSIYPTGTAEQFNVENFETTKLESEAFTEFLVKRQLEEKRKHRRENKEALMTYNMRTHEVQDVEDEPLDEEKDVVELEDVDLESLK